MLFSLLHTYKFCAIVALQQGAPHSILQNIASPSSSQLVIGLLTFFGVVITAAVSLIGVALRNALDRSTEARLKAENERNAVLARDSERRLKLDIAVRAVQLLSTPAGMLAPPIQRVGALFTLCSLDQFDLTLALLDSLLSTHQIESAATARILDDIITKGNERQQEGATVLLRTYTDRFLSEPGFDLPKSVLAGCPGGSEYLQSWAGMIVAQLFLARPLREWQDRPASVVSLIIGMVTLWRTTKLEWIRGDAGAILAVLLPILYPDDGVLQLGTQRVDIAEVREALSGIESFTKTADGIIQKIEDWSVAPESK